MSTTVSLAYPLEDVIVACHKNGNCYMIPKEQLPHGLLPNGESKMDKDGNDYAVETLGTNHIVTLIIGIILILIGVASLLYIIKTNQSICIVSELNNIMNNF